MTEKKQIPGFDNYYVDESGTIWSHRYAVPRIIRQSRNTDGSYKVKLYRDKKPYTRSVNSIIREVFGDLPESFIDATIAIDENHTTANLRIIPGFEDYSVSRCGAIFSNRHNPPRQIRQSKSTSGYSKVTLYKNKKPVTLMVHRLVYETFNCRVPDTLRIKHVNGDMMDNRLENLKLVPKYQTVMRSNGGICPCGISRFLVSIYVDGKRHDLFHGNNYRCKEVYFNALVAVETDMFEEFLSDLEEFKVSAVI